jgi:hypothetical protein
MKVVGAVSIESVGRGSSPNDHIALGSEINRADPEGLPNIMLGEAK